MIVVEVCIDDNVDRIDIPADRPKRLVDSLVGRLYVQGEQCRPVARIAEAGIHQDPNVTRFDCGEEAGYSDRWLLPGAVHHRPSLHINTSSLYGGNRRFLHQSTSWCAFASECGADLNA